ncbi:MAG: MSCRAMM family adhesin SdrC [Clostridiales bacterium]|nr:MSCRAMM family adhesin SdrC [Clostridiales bacterium]
MKPWTKILPVALLIFVLLVGYGMPNAINVILDRQIDGHVETVNTETTQLQMSSDLALIEKLQVMDSTASTVNLNSAQYMEYEGAFEQLMQELSLLFPASAPDPFSVSSFTETDHAITLFVYEEKSVLLWDFLLENEAGDQIRVLLDDDSGLILSFSYTREETKSETDSSDLFSVITDEKDTEPADYLDDLALRYVDYLQASYNLSGTEVSYNWARDLIEEWTSDSGTGTDQETDNEKINADYEDSDFDAAGNEDSMDLSREETTPSGSEAGTADEADAADEAGAANKADAADEADADSDESDKNTGSDMGQGESADSTATVSAIPGISPLWDSAAISERTGSTGSLWDHGRSDNKANASDSDEAVTVEEWQTSVHLTQNGEECVLDLNLDRSSLSIHSIAQ